MAGEGSFRASPSIPTERDADHVDELAALRKALAGLLTACREADAAGDLPFNVDGTLLDAAQAALDMRFPVIWTEEQVALLEARQANPMAHPYTCGGDRGDALHKAQAEEDGDDDTGILIPTTRGWICPACDYRQFWAHETGGPLAAQASDTAGGYGAKRSEPNPQAPTEEGGE